MKPLLIVLFSISAVFAQPVEKTNAPVMQNVLYPGEAEIHFPAQTSSKSEAKLTEKTINGVSVVVAQDVHAEDILKEIEQKNDNTISNKVSSAPEASITIDSSAPLISNDDVKLVSKMQLKSSDVEVSGIKGRIYDDAGEKSTFQLKKHEMNEIVSQSVPFQERIKNCQDKCGEGMNLFTVWTTPADGWNNKYTHSIDSALFHHPKAKVTIYSSSLPTDFLDDFKKLGYNTQVERLNVKERAVDTPLASWASQLEKWSDGPFYYAHLSDAVRLLVLYKEGGTYFDTDVVFVNPIDEVRNSIGWERSDSLCNAFMVFDSQNLFLKQVLTEFNDHYVMNEWAANGPVLLTNIYNRDFRNSNEVHAREKSAFYLISWLEVQKFFEKEAPKEIDHDLAVLKQGAYVVHFWNSRSHDLVVHPQSLMAKMFTTFCVYCNPITHEVLKNPHPGDKQAFYLTT